MNKRKGASRIDMFPFLFFGFSLIAEVQHDSIFLENIG